MGNVIANGTAALEAFIADLVDEISNNQVHWKEVISQPNYSDLQERFELLNNQRQATFYRILNLERKDRFIDIGAGIGAISACLSEDFKTGYALEPVKIFAELMRWRFKQDGQTHIEVVENELLSIPMESNSVDLALVNGVIPRIVQADPKNRPRQVLLKFVTEVKRSLVPGGKIVLGADNLWNYKRLLGGGSDSPYLFSHRAYLTLLEKAGYRNLKSYLVYPSLQSPKTIYSMEKATLNEFYLTDQNNNRIKKAIKAASDLMDRPYLLAYLGSSFYIEGQK